MISETSRLVQFQILRRFDNMVTADDKYPARHCENLLLAIQTELS